MLQRPSSGDRDDRRVPRVLAPRHPDGEVEVLKEEAVVTTAEVKEFRRTLLGGRPPVGLPLPPGVERDPVTLPGERRTPNAEYVAREVTGKAMMNAQ